MIDAIQGEGIERWRPKHPEGVQRNLSQLGFSWDAETLRSPVRLTVGMVRGEDPFTSQKAAIRVLPKLGKVEAMVLALIREKPQTAGELEKNPIFVGVCAMNTVRTRTSALKRKGLIEDSGEERLNMTVWRAV